MLNNWKEKILHGWTLMRILRLGLAFIVIGEAIKNSEILFALLGSILLFQGLFNVGCCGTSGCYVNPKKNKQKSFNNTAENISFEEIK